MLTKELINCLNKQLPTLEDIINKFQRINIQTDKNKALTHLETQKFYYYENVNSNQVDPITELVECTNANLISIGSINIYTEFHIHHNKNLFEFASFNDFYRICLFKDDLSVILINDESDETELVTLYSEDFLDFLCEYNKYYQRLVYGITYDKGSFRTSLNKLVEHGFSKMLISQLIKV